MNFKMSIKKQLQELKSVLPKQVTLVAVSKTKPVQDLMKAYDVGQRVAYTGLERSHILP